MSRSKDTRPDPRIAIKEEIITRNKAAQLKRQLQEKESSIPKVSPSPVKAKRGRKRKNESINLDMEPKKKHVTKSKKAAAKKQPKVVENKEYFPNNLKRPYKTDKVVLKPKMESKLIGGMNSINKRKLMVPKRVTDATIAYKESEDDRLEDKSSELSMAELLQISEDTESLTEEDWLEILTCPSPVWWEDPPSPQYCEDPISTRFEVEECTRTKAAEETGSTDLKSEAILKVADLNTCIDLKHTDNKFMRKRSKLENLLGSIKNKLVPNHSLEFNNKKDSVDISDSCELNKNNDINKRIDAVEEKLEVNENPDTFKAPQSCDEMNKSSEEDNILDASLDDALLETLESLYIPIENENVGGNDERTRENKEEILKEDSVKTEEIKQVIDNDSDSALIGHSILKEASPASVRIDNPVEVEEENCCVVGENKASKEKSVNAFIDSFEIEPSTSVGEEFVTLYKIVSSDNETVKVGESNEVFMQSDEDKSKIDGFYKKRKHSSGKRNSNQKELNEHSCEQKLVAVCDKQNIKYCTKCSSIFDTEICMYCDKRSDKETASHGSNKNRLCAI